jgi:hypothetical protein
VPIEKTELLVDPANLPSMVKWTSGNITETVCWRHFQGNFAEDPTKPGRWVFRYQYLEKVEPVDDPAAKCWDCTH